MARDNDFIPKVRIRYGAVVLRKIGTRGTRTHDLTVVKITTDASDDCATTSCGLSNHLEITQTLKMHLLGGGGRIVLCLNFKSLLHKGTENGGIKF